MYKIWLCPSPGFGLATPLKYGYMKIIIATINRYLSAISLDRHVYGCQNPDPD